MLNIAIIHMLPLYRKNCSMSLHNVVPAQDNEHRDLLGCAPGMVFLYRSCVTPLLSGSTAQYLITASLAPLTFISLNPKLKLIKLQTVMGG